jgi:anti-anti-sigma regulatory factor
VSVEQIDERTAVVIVAGDPLGAAADELGSCVGSLLDDGVVCVVVDFSRLPVLNSKLLDALVRASARQPAIGPGGIAVVTGQGYVRQILEISETGGVVLLAETREDALEALGCA